MIPALLPVIDTEPLNFHKKLKKKPRRKAGLSGKLFSN